MLDKEDIELLLFSGLPIEIDNVGKLYPYKLREIVEMGYSNYNQKIGYAIYDKSNVDDENEELSKISNFEFVLVSCVYNEFFREQFIKSLSFFFKEPVYLHIDGFFYLGDLKEKRVIDGGSFEYVQELICKINCVKKQKDEEDYNPGNDKAKEFIEKLKRLKRNRPKTKSDVNLLSILSSVAWKSHMGINVFDLTIYQLYDALNRLGLIDTYQNTMRGLYAGTVDKNKINLKEINWTKIINE